MHYLINSILIYKNLKKLFTSIVLGLLFISTTECYKILSLFPYAGKSHFNVFLPIANELASRGHDMTLVQPFRHLDAHKNIKIIFIPSIEEARLNMSEALFTKKKSLIDSRLIKFKGMAVDVCKHTVTSKEFLSLLEKGKQFDIVIINVIFNECALAISSLLGSQFVVFSAGPLPGYVRNPGPKSYSEVPNYYLPIPAKMNFFQKMENTLVTLRDLFLYHYSLIPNFQEILQQHVPEALPITESWNKITLFVQNSDPIVVPLGPTVPNVISVMCPQCRKAKQLPKDIETFINGSEDNGFIIFSLGSFVQSKHLPQKVAKCFLDGFSRLKQRVLWKIEDDSFELPPNVKINKWLPQQDLLGSSKIRLFITHGGLLSLQEAVYHGVPVLGIPMFGDQIGNLARIEELRLGLKLDLNNITEEVLYTMISNILNDNSYKERIDKASKILKDKDSDGASKGAFWIEYVARHNGTHHLRNFGENMSLIQYFLVDVITVLLIILLVTFYIIKLIIKMIWNQCITVKRKVD